MYFFNDLPQRNRAHDIAELAETAFRATIEKYELFVVQQEDRKDYGTDVQVEARDGKSMTNIRAHVQLKGTESAMNADCSVSVSVARTNLNYLLNHADSIYVCYHIPSKSLLARYADDIYRDYEHSGKDWLYQDRVTINFTQVFDEQFQRRLHARLLASGKSSRDRRLQWLKTPPEQIPTLVQHTTAVIYVPNDPELAKKMLSDLYQAGDDVVISNSFAQFAAILTSIPGAMDLAYMAEINLGVNGLSFDEERVRQSIKVIGESMERGDVHPGSLLYCLGNAWLALGNYQKAQEVYRTALTELDNSKLSNVAAQCSKNLGAALEKVGKMYEARAFYARALELAPELGEAHFALALWHRRKGNDPWSALEHLDRVFPQGGTAIQMSTVQGWRIDLLFNTGNTEGAFREINNLLGQASKADWIWPWCAKQVAQFGKTSVEAAQKALRFWRAYLREHPSDIAAERERLFCLWRLRSAGIFTEIDFDGFKHSVIQLIESGDPDPAYLWDRVGHWAQYDGDWTNAERAYRKAYELESKRYGYCLGTALNFLRRYREALSILLPQAEKYLPDAKSWFQVAVAREGVGDLEECILAYQHALKFDPDYDLAWFNLGGIYWNSGDVEKAAKVWQEAVKRFPNHELAKKLHQDFPLLFCANHEDDKDG